jgi:3-oxoacyl-[acyl-carrier protein] reductase
MRLEGKTAIITGAGRGLGRAAAIEMAKEGASVAILSRTPSELDETAKLISGEVVYFKADVSNPDDIKNVVDKTISIFGRIDILMNNASVVGPVKPVFEVEEKEWDEVFRINLIGVHLFSKEVIPHMIRQNSGKIINVTSGLGEMVMPLFGVYSITKAGVIQLTKTMAEELKAYNIQVNGLDPGVMDTDMQEEIRKLGPEVLGEIYDEFLVLKEKGHLRPPEEVARLAVFLASEESDSITGENGTETHYMRFGYTGNPRLHSDVI